jgi:hypothetical protein
MRQVYTHKKCLLFRGIDTSVEARNSSNVLHEMARVVNTALQNGDSVYLFKRACSKVEYRHNDARNVCSQPCLTIVFNVFSFL